MVPTLVGRLQTRVFLLAFIGSIITAAITPVLPVDTPVADRFRVTFAVLAAVAVLGLGWELIYHLLMQWRWEKDWPTLFGLTTIVPEGLLVGWLAIRNHLPYVRDSVPFWAFVVQFTAVWLAVWLFANGPMRAPFIRWRFRGGRLI